jgi:hypothetical protein
MVIFASTDYVVRQVAMAGNEVRTLSTWMIFPKGNSINNDEDGNYDGGCDDNELAYYTVKNNWPHMLRRTYYKCIWKRHTLLYNTDRG